MLEVALAASLMGLDDFVASLSIVSLCSARKVSSSWSIHMHPLRLLPRITLLQLILKVVHSASLMVLADLVTSLPSSYVYSVIPMNWVFSCEVSVDQFEYLALTPSPFGSYCIYKSRSWCTVLSFWLYVHYPLALSLPLALCLLWWWCPEDITWTSA